MYLEREKGAKLSTLNDYRLMVAEPPRRLDHASGATKRRVLRYGTPGHHLDTCRPLPDRAVPSQHGLNHRRATHLGRAWTRTIWRCWQTRTPYYPARQSGPITLLVPQRSGFIPGK